jgi:hypothetical protein
MKTTPKTCPYCSAPVKHPSRLRNQYPNDDYMTMTTYQCGTAASIHWTPPVRGKNCHEAPKEAS